MEKKGLNNLIAFDFMIKWYVISRKSFFISRVFVESNVKDVRDILIASVLKILKSKRII